MTQALLLLLLASLPASPAPSLRVVAHNDLPAPRREAAVEVPLERLAALGAPALLRVVDESGRDVLAQALDLDDDARPESLLFLADLPASGSRTFRVEAGGKRVYEPSDFRARGRFVRERRDDFTWENDRIAHRMYGQALETWDHEPLTSSGIDAWFKRTPRLVIDEWYMADDYHRDNGEGADLYSVGPSRGCGGSGLWRHDRLWSSRNFRRSRVLANGPLRVVFELEYEPWDAGGASVSETKRVTLDAGSQLNLVESRYRVHGKSDGLAWAAGIKTPAGTTTTFDPAAGILHSEEPVKDGQGTWWCGVIVDPSGVVADPAAEPNRLVASRLTDARATYRFGFAWSKAGHVKDGAAWKAYLDDAARAWRSPVRVEVLP
jgi:hypothetical protein